MEKILPHSPLAAEELAERIALSRQARRRVSRTERLWLYRSYEGGEPANTIDWKLSARGEKILVREAEQIVTRPVFLFSPSGEETGFFLLSALGHMLLKTDRNVGWLSPELRKTKTVSILRTLLAERPAQKEWPETPDLHQSALVLAGNLAAAPELWLARIQAFAEQGNKGVLLDFSGQKETKPARAAQNLGWPVIRMTSETPPEEPLLLLFEEALKASV